MDYRPVRNASPLRFLTIAQVTSYIKEMLDADFLLQDLWLMGEVSNYIRSSAGHVYLTLKDESAQIRCVLWRSQVARRIHLPQQGEAILAHGYVSLYEAGGSYQFYIDDIQPAGLGQLHLEFEMLKERLQQEGLFAAERKRPLPPFPHCIGVVTSPSGAALRDILNILGRRYPLVRVIVAPTLVQGTEAPQQIVAALQALNARRDVDLIIVARGGGSLEELAAFNDERVARAIYSARVPVICGIGHETDFTIADFVADVRAPTPSAAAELAVPDQQALREKIATYRQQLAEYIGRRINAHRSALTHSQQVLVHHSPQRVLAQYRQHLDEVRQRAATHLAHRLALQRGQLRSYASRLQSLSPFRTLERGYAIVRELDSGAVVRSISQVAEGGGISVQVSDGMFGAVVNRGTCFLPEDGFLEGEK